MFIQKFFFILIVTISILSFSINAEDVFKVGKIETISGEKISGFINVPPGEDSGELDIPVTVINGSKEGPVLALFAGVHGYEYPPVIAMMRLIKELNPKLIAGKIIIVHVANIPSFPKNMISPFVPTSTSMVPTGVSSSSAAIAALTVSAPIKPVIKGRVRTSALGLKRNPMLWARNRFSSTNWGSYGYTPIDDGL